METRSTTLARAGARMLAPPPPQTSDAPMGAAMGECDDTTPDDRIDAYSFFRAMHHADAAPDASSEPTDELPPPRIVASNETAHDGAQQVVVSLETPETKWARVRYTTDGSEPTAVSPMFRRPFALHADDLDDQAAPLVVRARAFKGRQCSAAVARASFTRKAPPPATLDRPLGEARRALRMLPSAVVSGVLRVRSKATEWVREHANAFGAAIRLAADPARMSATDEEPSTPTSGSINVKIISVECAHDGMSELRFAVEVTEPRSPPPPTTTTAAADATVPAQPPMRRRSAAAAAVATASAAPLKRATLAQQIAGSLTSARLRLAFASARGLGGAEDVFGGVDVAVAVALSDVHHKVLARVRLELRWGFPEPAPEPTPPAAGPPEAGVDFLDGSALAYAGTELLDIVDYRGALRKQSTALRRAVGAHPDGQRLTTGAAAAFAVGDEVEASCEFRVARPRAGCGAEFRAGETATAWFTARIVSIIHSDAPPRRRRPAAAAGTSGSANAEAGAGGKFVVLFDDGNRKTCVASELRRCGARERACTEAKRAIGAAVRHSGDQIDEAARTGAQSITIDLVALDAVHARAAKANSDGGGAARRPRDGGTAARDSADAEEAAPAALSFVTDVYFTLSAFKARSLARFRAPAVRLFDADRPEHELCAYSIASAGDVQAVVMAALVRTGDAEGGGAAWRVDAFGAQASGNVKAYTPLRETIEPLQEARATEVAAVLAARARVRAEVVRLAALWESGRAMPVLRRARDGATRRRNAATALATLFDLECEDAKRRVISFL